MSVAYEKTDLLGRKAGHASPPKNREEESGNSLRQLADLKCSVLALKILQKILKQLSIPMPSCNTNDDRGKRKAFKWM